MEGVMVDELEEQWARWMREAEVRGAEFRDALDDVWQRFENAGLLTRVVVHRVTCRRCGPVVTCIRVGEQTLARHKAVKLGRGKNAATSADAARRELTLDGERWWPAMTESLNEASRWVSTESAARRVLAVRCRHLDTVVEIPDLLAVCDRAEPGKPGRPTLL